MSDKAGIGKKRGRSASKGGSKNAITFGVEPPRASRRTAPDRSGPNPDGCAGDVNETSDENTSENIIGNRRDDKKTKDRNVIDILRPEKSEGPVLYASPHSGRAYPADFLKMSQLDKHALRQSEDGYVDLLFDDAPMFGAPLLRALFPRAYIDVNRARDELDPRMFAETLPDSVDGRSNRVRAGLGVVPRIVADGHDIYNRKLRYVEVKKRLKTFYDPYHHALETMINDAIDRCGCAVLIDCHSMPSVGGAPFREGDRVIDFVLGDRYGSSCARSLTSLVEQTLSKMGYHVSRNAPYAGGHVASAIGRPEQGVHVLQIEVNRALYLDEARLTRHSGFNTLRSHLRELMGELSNISPLSLQAVRAAE